ncbi:MAG: PrgI family protein [bacterium]|nr:PrgI family protein [bacterium]
MAQYQVPQFIETQDKIVGPLTIKQFLYLAAGTAIIFITFFIFKFLIWAVIAVIVGIISLAIALIKYNGRPLPTVLFSAFKYIWKPRTYTWQREEAKIEVPEVKIPKMPSAPKPTATPIPSTEEAAPVPLKNLWLKITTSHETKQTQPAAREHKSELFQLFKKLTGEREVTRRIDYR